ncbi:hypothetical protein D032_3987 [Vibrio parahaemolyticus V14/01]|nr:hypothetical protein D032_3987 [Vibrio parahaemolyticus V14/01]
MSNLNRNDTVIVQPREPSDIDACSIDFFNLNFQSHHSIFSSLYYQRIIDFENANCG